MYQIRSCLRPVYQVLKDFDAKRFSYFNSRLSMDSPTRYLLASIVESSQDSIVSIDLNRVITSWNKGAEELYGYRADEAIGRPLEMVMLPEDIQGLIDKVQDIIDEITVPVYETIRLHKNGKQAELEILLSPVRNGKGEVVGISTVARDITVRKMQEKQKDDFIAVASRELKTPVTVISAYTQLLQDRLQTVEDEESRLMIGKLAGQVEKLAGLIGILLDTTKLAAGEMLLNLEELNLNDLIDEQVEIFSLLLARCRIDFKPGAIKKVMADRKLITRVISNIISNAGKYSPSGGMIIIATKSIGEHVEISVQDFGVGIPVSEQTNIFGRYFRVNASDVTAASGLGLGLYISVGILQQHGGNIRVESKEGSGSTFFITLPYSA